MASRISSPRSGFGGETSSNGHRPVGSSKVLPGGSLTGDTPAAQQSAATDVITSRPPKLRRRPALIALGVALVALGGASAAWLTTTVGHTQGVLAVRASLDRGEVIEADDLVTANINPDPVLRTVPIKDREQVVGKRAAVDLAAGALITPESVTVTTIPATGRSLVGLSLTFGQLPAQPLRQGDTVRIVDTPRAQDDPPARTPASTSATVVEAHSPGEDGRLIVDVTVPAGEAVSLAARAATGRVALVLDPGSS